MPGKRSLGDDLRIMFRICTMGFRFGPKHSLKFMACQCFCFAIFVWFVYSSELYWRVYHFGQSFAFKGETMPDINVLKHFHDANNDGGRLLWHHAVNSKTTLRTALNGHAMMLEADVMLRGQGTNNQAMVPVMAHPPATTSDVTLEEWLIGIDLHFIAEEVMASHKGIKLDFKSIESVEISLQHLKHYAESAKRPVWLNADIINGPNYKSSGAEGAKDYEWMHILEMQQILRHTKVTQPVNFPVRAALVSNCLPLLLWLLEMVPQSTITMWMTRTDDVPLMNLMYIRMRLPRDRVFFDLPALAREAFDKLLKNEQHGAVVRSPLSDTEVMTFHGDDWHIQSKNEGQQVFLGTEAVVLREAMLVTKKPYESSEAKPVRMIGLVTFLDLPVEDDASKAADRKLPNKYDGLEIVFQLRQSGRPDSFTGVKVIVGIRGHFAVATQGIPGVDLRKEAVATGFQRCTRFEIVYRAKHTLTLLISRPNDCTQAGKVAVTQASIEVDIVDIDIDSHVIGLRSTTSKSFAAIHHLQILA